MRLTEKINILARGLAYAFGVVLGFFIGSAGLKVVSENKFSELEAEVDRNECVEQPKIFIDPLILIGRDCYGFSFAMRPTRDSAFANETEVLQKLADAAAECYVKGVMADNPQTEIDAWLTVYTGNRGVHVKASFRIDQAADGSSVQIILPASERERWGHLDRSMRCFLN